MESKGKVKGRNGTGKDTSKRIDFACFCDSTYGHDAVMVIHEGYGDIRKSCHRRVYRILGQHDGVYTICCVCWYTGKRKKKNQLKNRERKKPKTK
jgi:hypothetical protein